MRRRRVRAVLRGWPYGVTLVAVLWACGEACRAAAGLSWPHDQDLYRDLSQATAFREGRWLADPLYCGETRWYNPLVPAVVAAGSRLTRLTPALVYTRAGTWLNLMAPLSFFALARELAGGPVAALATLHFLLLLDPGAPSWAEASYSPWLFAANLAQAPFYLALGVLLRAWQRDRLRDFVATGALTGLTFLGHTAPALILALVVVAGAARRWRPGALVRHAALAGAALLVSAPLLIPIAVRYGLVVRNPAPMEWRFEPRPHPLPAEAWAGVALALAGAWMVARRSRSRISAFVLLCWPSACLMLFLSSRAGDALRARGIPAPALVPGFHFTFALHAAESVLFGWALWRLIGWAAARLARHGEGTAQHRPRVAAMAIAAMAVLFARPFAAYATRDDLALARVRAQELGGHEGWQAVREWLGAHARPREVVLANAETSLFVVGPTGRCVVAVEDVFANPFADQHSRERARDKMFTRLRSGDGAGFRTLAEPLGVHLVVAGPFERVRPQAGLVRELDAGGFTVWRLP